MSKSLWAIWHTIEEEVWFYTIVHRNQIFLNFYKLSASFVLKTKLLRFIFGWVKIIQHQFSALVVKRL